MPGDARTMPFGVFRPWGNLAWLLERSDARHWSYLGCLSAEDRSLAAWLYLNDHNMIAHEQFVTVSDPPSSRFSETVEARIRENRERFVAQGGDVAQITEVDLFSRVSTIVDIVDDFVSRAGGNIVIDITTFPKRFFFPIVRLILDDGSADNIIACYTLADKYTKDDLAEDPEPWSKLPLYPERFPPEEPEVLVVALGFQPLGLPNMMESAYAEAETMLLFPFPAPPSHVRRVWHVVDRLEDYAPAPGIEPTFLAGHDLPEIFAHLCEATVYGDRYSVFAPYGPKPMSLAMALMGRAGDFPCYYTQPKAYNPNYSTGVKMVDGRPECMAYYLKLQGEEVYTLQR